MKRFLLFAGYNYYPRGGANDLQDSFDTEEEAIVEGNKLTNLSLNYAEYDWFNIIDTKEGEL
jgi:hypothetical protein